MWRKREEKREKKGRKKEKKERGRENGERKEREKGRKRERRKGQKENNNDRIWAQLASFPGHLEGLGMRLGTLHQLTKTNKYFLFLFVFLQLVFFVDGTVVTLLSVLHNVECSEVNAIVEVTKEEQVMEVGGEVELAQTLVLQCSHAF